MQRADWNLLVLAAAGGQPLSPVQYQKALFLLSRNVPMPNLGDDFYQFRPYDYGPFDETVYRDGAVLMAKGLATRSESGQRWTEYAATPDGLERAKVLRSQLSPAVADYVSQVVAWVRSQSFPSLVQAIYRAYPDMKANSIFQY